MLFKLVLHVLLRLILIQTREVHIIMRIDSLI